MSRIPREDWDKLAKARGDDPNADSSHLVMGGGRIRDYVTDGPEDGEDVGGHRIYRPVTLDDLIAALESIRSSQFHDDGDVPIVAARRSTGVDWDPRPLGVDYGVMPDGSGIVIVGDGSFIPVENRGEDGSLELLEQDDDPDGSKNWPDETVTAVIAAARAVHDGDFVLYNRLATEDPGMLRAGRIADGLASRSMDFDGALHSAALRALNLMDDGRA